MTALAKPQLVTKKLSQSEIIDAMVTRAQQEHERNMEKFIRESNEAHKHLTDLITKKFFEAASSGDSKLKPKFEISTHSSGSCNIEFDMGSDPQVRKAHERYITACAKTYNRFYADQERQKIIAAMKAKRVTEILSDKTIVGKIDTLLAEIEAPLQIQQ